MSSARCSCNDAVSRVDACFDRSVPAPITITYTDQCAIHGPLYIDFEIYVADPGPAQDGDVPTDKTCIVYLNGRLVDWFDTRGAPQKISRAEDTDGYILVK